jgi:hypothetical protein
MDHSPQLGLEVVALDDPSSARVKKLSVFALIVGTLEVSRSLADRTARRPWSKAGGDRS